MNKKLTFRLLKRSDIPEVYTMIRDNYDYVFARDARKEMECMFTTEYFSPTFIVALLDEKIIGVLGYCQSCMDYRFYEIFWVNIRGSYQNKGYGTQLMQHAIKVIKKIRGKGEAVSILLQTIGPRFYSRLGFKTLFKFNDGENFLMSLNVRC